MTAAAFAAVRAQWPHWTDAQIVRHLQQRAELVRIAQQQQARRVAACLHEVYEVRQ